jgi:hypothetical protein
MTSPQRPVGQLRSRPRQFWLQRVSKCKRSRAAPQHSIPYATNECLPSVVAVRGTRRRIALGRPLFFDLAVR